MLQIDIKDLDGNITNSGQFKSQEEVDAWLSENAANFGKEGEWTSEQRDISAEVEKMNAEIESLKLLDKTDWYIIRELETGKPAPLEIKAQRAAARAELNKGQE